MVQPAIAAEPTLPTEVSAPLVVLDIPAPVEAGAPAPVVSAPVPAPTPTLAPALTPPQLDEYTRRRLARADQLEAQQQEQETRQLLQQEVDEFRQSATRRGISEEDQAWFIERHTRTVMRTLDQQRRFREQQEYLTGKQNASYAIGQEYEVDPQILMSGNSPEEMRGIAQREKYYREQDRRLTRVEQTRVPAQAMNQTGTSLAGGQVVNKDNIDLLHSQGRVSDETYRKFLATGVIR